MSTTLRNVVIWRLPPGAEQFRSVDWQLYEPDVVTWLGLTSGMRVCTAHGWPHQGVHLQPEHVLCPRSAAHPLPWQQLHGCSRASISGGSRLASLQAVVSQQSSDAVLEAASAAELATAGNPSAHSLVEVGILHGPHGVRGEIKVQPLTDFPEERLGSAGVRYACQPACCQGSCHCKPVCPTG